jgi:hypothetical protein
VDFHRSSHFAFANPYSVAWGLDHFAWAALGVALIFAFALNISGQALDQNYLAKSKAIQKVFYRRFPQI